MSYEEEGARGLEDAPIVKGTGAVELYGGKEKRPGFFVKVLRYRQTFLEVNWISVDKVECKCRLAL